jgi:hypothetical protein
MVARPIDAGGKLPDRLRDCSALGFNPKWSCRRVIREAPLSAAQTPNVVFGQEKILTGATTAAHEKSVRSPFCGGDLPRSGLPPASAYDTQRNRLVPCSTDRRPVMYLRRGTLAPWRSLRSGFPP